MPNFHIHIDVVDPEADECNVCGSRPVLYICVTLERGVFLCASCDKAELASIRAAKAQ